MMKYALHLALYCLALTALAPAQEWELLEPEMPVLGAPNEEVLCRLAGPAGKKVQLALEGANMIGLEETEPGQYSALVRIPPQGSTTLELRADETKAMGDLAVLQEALFFEATSEIVTRQGPHPIYDRLTPIYPGTRVRVDGRRGSWYRSAGSGTWLDGRSSELQRGFVPPNRLQRVQLKEAENGDALLILECARPPEIQVSQSSDLKSLKLRLEDTLQTCFDIKRPSEVAPFLGPVLLTPRASDRSVELELSSLGFRGFQIEPQALDNSVTVRIRKPLPKAFSGLRITVDAGHGGAKDPGTTGHGGLAEKTLNLRVAKVLAEKLQALGAEVVMTRTDDNNVADSEEGDASELQARIDLSIKEGSQLFLSLHHNARPSVEEGKIYHGTDVYWYQAHSQALAKSLADPIAEAIGEVDRSYRWRSFYVIRQTHALAVLIEFQYLSNPLLESSVLSSEIYPEQASEAVITGLKSYLSTQP